MMQQAAYSRAVLWSDTAAIVAVQLLVLRAACLSEQLRMRVQTWSRIAIGALRGVPTNMYVGPPPNPPCVAPVLPPCTQLRLRALLL